MVKSIAPVKVISEAEVAPKLTVPPLVVRLVKVPSPGVVPPILPGAAKTEGKFDGVIARLDRDWETSV